MKRIGLRGGLLLALGGIQLAGLGILVLTVSLNARNELTTISYLASDNLAEACAADFQALIAGAEESVRGAARAMRGFKAAGASRAAATGALRIFLEDREGATGLWVAFAPGAYDGADARGSGGPGSGPNGRFEPYWYRGAEGPVLDLALASDETGAEGAAYSAAFLSGRASVSRPTLRSRGGKELSLVSVCLPIVEGGKPIGVAGIDFESGILQALVAAIKPLGVGYAYLMEGDGTRQGARREERRRFFRGEQMARGFLRHA
jgi:methyl-accepting chemotaxis protein